MAHHDADAQARYRAHADLCKVLTDPKRLMLLDALCSAERSVGDLAEALGVSLPNASQHLAVLRNAGLVEARRDGTSVRYRLTEPAIVAACGILDDIVRRRLGQPAAPRSAAPARSVEAPTGSVPTLSSA